jgi:hypothetical protein
MISYQQSIQRVLSAIEGNILRYQRFFYEAPQKKTMKVMVDW